LNPLAIAFAWAWGLSDWRTGEALGVSENRVRRARQALGLRKTGRGMPHRSLFPDASNSAGAGAGYDRTMRKAAAGANRDGLNVTLWGSHND
jgi:hypothetical protein